MRSAAPALAVGSVAVPGERGGAGRSGGGGGAGDGGGGGKPGYAAPRCWATEAWLRAGRFHLVLGSDVGRAVSRGLRWGSRAVRASS